MATAFGLDITAERPVSLLAHARALPTGRTLALRWGEEDEEQAWPLDAQAICTRRDAEGSPEFAIAAHDHAGYRIWGRGRGCYLLSRDGRRVHALAEGASQASCARFLIGQVLPFAALLSGLEIFHASAVSLGDGAVAFVGPSGAGKTSLALELCRRGAVFLADDVLALEVDDGVVIAHPGTPVAGVALAELDRLAAAGRPLAGADLGGDSRERLFGLQGARAPVPLHALFFLQRVAQELPDARFEPVGDALTLLAATFNFALETPQRSRGLLEVCALIARRRVERVCIGASLDPAALADAVIARLHGSGGSG